MSSALKIPLSFHVTSGYWLVFAAATAEVLPVSRNAPRRWHDDAPQSVAVLAATAGA